MPGAILQALFFFTHMKTEVVTHYGTDKPRCFAVPKEAIIRASLRQRSDPPHIDFERSVATYKWLKEKSNGQEGQGS